MDLSPITSRPLPYQDNLHARPSTDIDLLVIHCTELPDLETARSFGERLLYPESGTGNSGHFYIDRNGSVEQWVQPTRIAHHVRGYNPRSVGVELVNRGRYPQWFHSEHQFMSEGYPPAQIMALLQLIARLRETLPQLRWIAGHDDLDREWISADNDPAVLIRRKQDPGPLFPWQRLMSESGLQRFQPTPEEQQENAPDATS